MTVGESLIIENDVFRVNALEFSADGRMLAAADRDGTILIWTIGEAVEKRVMFESSHKPLYRAVIHPDNQVAATCGGGGGTIRIWGLPFVVGAESSELNDRSPLPAAPDFESADSLIEPVLLREIAMPDRESRAFAFRPTVAGYGRRATASVCG